MFVESHERAGVVLAVERPGAVVLMGYDEGAVGAESADRHRRDRCSRPEADDGGSYISFRFGERPSIAKLNPPARTQARIGSVFGDKRLATSRLVRACIEAEPGMRLRVSVVRSSRAALAHPLHLELIQMRHLRELGQMRRAKRWTLVADYASESTLQVTR